MSNMDEILNLILDAARKCSDEDFMEAVVQHNLLRQEVRKFQMEEAELLRSLYYRLGVTQDKVREIPFEGVDLVSLGGRDVRPLPRD